MRRMTNFWAFIKKLAGLISFTGNKIEVGNDLEVDGKLKAFENITDANDKLRFVDGNITTSEVSGITYNYAKWSLSGSHLMIVVAGTSSPNNIVPVDTKFAEINLPKWILDKLRIITASVVSYNKVDYQYYNASVTQNLYCIKSTNKIEILSLSQATTPNYNSCFRIQFDFLIDTSN